MALDAPVGQRHSFVLGPDDSSGDLLDGLDPEGLELASGSRGIVLVPAAATIELPVYCIGRVREQGDSRSNSATNEVRGFEYARAVGIDRNDDDVCRLNRIIDSENVSGHP